MSDMTYQQMCEVAEAVPENEEPPLCSCGGHYVGADCPESAQDGEDIVPCEECGHLHFDYGANEYVPCPLASEGCTCDRGAEKTVAA